MLWSVARPALAGESAGTNSQPERSGGETTVFDVSRDAYSLPARNITSAHRTAFLVGKSFFEENWVAAPSSVSGRDGLGPLFNARSCSACHFKDGRSRPPEEGEPLSVMLLRVSVPGVGPHGGPLPEPGYGGQIQGRALPGVRPEADVVGSYQEVRGQFIDGEEFSLRKPTYSLQRPGYGGFAEDVLMSPRVAPAMIGMGLLEAVSEETLRSAADPEDKNHDGVSGRLNEVWDETVNRRRPGRFGWKAEQPSILQQVATAFVEDMGITSWVKPQENHYPRPLAIPVDDSCLTPEVSDSILEQVVVYSSLLGVPARRNPQGPMVRRGEQLFRQLKCTGCHLPKLETGPHPALPELSDQTIHPYTDLLLHDMGEELSDERPSFKAQGNEWRTPPLWGLGLLIKVNQHQFLLHDGRARGIVEAILWHGGEATAAREAFRTLAKSERHALVEFLQSL